MPFKSDAQRKFFNANRDKLEGQGVDVSEWNNASKGLNLPDYATPSSLAQKSPYRGPRRRVSAGPEMYKPRMPKS